MNTATSTKVQSTGTSLIKSAGYVAAACVAAAAAMLLSAAPARAAGSDEVTSVKVRFGDLDVGSVGGARELYLRLRNAAQTACGDDGEYIDLTELRGISQCEQKAIESAVAQVGRPLLTALYDSHFPRQPLTQRVPVSDTSSAQPSAG